MNWLNQLFSWFSDPILALKPKYIAQLLPDGESYWSRTWIWQPKDAKTNHKISIYNRGFKSITNNVEQTKWIINVKRHKLLNQFEGSGVEYTFVNNGEEPSNETMFKLLELVGFVDYRRELD